MQVKDIIKEIELFAPLNYQENYDNSGLQIGNEATETNSALLALDITETVVEEAIGLNCHLIIAHHPLLFSGLKRITGKGEIERVVTKAIQNGIAIYTAHTNLDNMLLGVNHKIAEKLGLIRRHVLAPLRGKLFKLQTYIPHNAFEKVRQALFDVGAGKIGLYDECSFSWEGQGSFRGLPGSNPEIGKAGGMREYVPEKRLELIVPEELMRLVSQTLKQVHPYEEVAYEWVLLENENQTVGAGLIGELARPVPIDAFLDMLQHTMKTKCIRYTEKCKDVVQKVALCGGSGSFLLKDAIRNQADIFITADFKYHQFFDADRQIIIADIGHYESEQFTIEIFSEIIKKKFPNFATHFTKVNTNPVNYYF